ncbi:hypothetical protein [Burkholderia contaminans]|uniref:hypothetical protein n=1 Tax=Burkholderia contaminans TaxID=488447 RepID=UPI001F128E05|nr:hypothetical protein [Burkholderia contaminans]UMY33422.1 hypothetical protein MMB18_38540 [Burkholderia contaminans]
MDPLRAGDRRDRHEHARDDGSGHTQPRWFLDTPVKSAGFLVVTTNRRPDASYGCMGRGERCDHVWVCWRGVRCLLNEGRRGEDYSPKIEVPDTADDHPGAVFVQLVRGVENTWDVCAKPGVLEFNRFRPQLHETPEARHGISAPEAPKSTSG